VYFISQKQLDNLQVCWNTSCWNVENLRSETFRFLSRA